MQYFQRDAALPSGFCGDQAVRELAPPCHAELSEACLPLRLLFGHGFLADARNDKLLFAIEIVFSIGELAAGSLLFCGFVHLAGDAVEDAV